MTAAKRTTRKRTPAKCTGTRRQSPLELSFSRLWSMHPRFGKHPFKAEHRFDTGRQWRFDFAWPAAMVAVELEGGTWSRRRKSRHTTASGHQEDCDKYNAAAIAGWCVLRYTAKDLQARPLQIMDEIVGAIERRRTP